MADQNPRLKFYEIVKTFKEQIMMLLSDKTLTLTESQRQENIRKLENMYDKMMLAKSTNSRLPIELFYRSLFIPYGINILKQDDNFFLQDNIQTIGGDSQSDIKYDVLIREIRLLWTMLDNDNKRTMWRYIIALCKIADTVMDEGYFDQLKKTINN